MGEGGGGEEKGRFLSFRSFPFSLPSFPFSPETPDTQANELVTQKANRYSVLWQKSELLSSV